MAGYASNLRPLPDSSLDPDTLESVFAQGMRGAEGAYQVPFFLASQRQRMARGDMLQAQNAQTNAVSAALAQRELDNVRLGHLTQLAGQGLPAGMSPTSLVNLRPEFGMAPDPAAAASEYRTSAPIMQAGALASMFQHTGQAAESSANAGIDPMSYIPMLSGARRQTPTSVLAAQAHSAGAGGDRVTGTVDSAGNPGYSVRSNTVEGAQAGVRRVQGQTQAQGAAFQRLQQEGGTRGAIVGGNPAMVGGNMVVSVQTRDGRQSTITVDPNGRVTPGRPQGTPPSARQ